MTRPSLCQSSKNFARPAVNDGLKEGRLLLRNISNHVATKKSHNHESPRGPAPQLSMDPSLWRINDIPCSKESKDWPPFLSRSSRKRSVSFREEVTIRFTTTISLDKITPQEYSAIWYSSEEYDKITRACSKQIERLNRGELPKDENKLCSRGLECHTHARSLAKAMNRSMAYRAVLEEQNRQAEEGVFHDDAISRLYHDVSASCQIWAHAVALADQREAEDIQDSGC